jgi:hypothetical protein
MENNIKVYLAESLKIINSNRILLFIHALSLTNYAFKNVPKDILPLLGILSLLVMPVIYGRFIEIIKEEQPISLYKVFRKHLTNYFVCAVCIALPAFLFMFIFIWILPKEVVMDVFPIIFLINSSSLLYLFPFAFLQGKQSIEFSTLALAAKCLFTHFRYNVPLILLNISVYFIYQIRDEIFEGYLLKNVNIYMLITSRFLFSLLLSVILLTLFIAASGILIKEPFYKKYITTQST